MPTHNFFLSEALVEARKAFKRDEVPVGAVVTYKNEIIARAHNLVEQKKDATAHAERLALAIACRKLKKKYLTECTLYSSLEPCMMCAACCYWLQVPLVYFGAKDPKRGYRSWHPTLFHPKAVVQLLPCGTESQDLLRRFFQAKREASKKSMYEPF